ncbi:MAG: hypothetical protein IKP95_04205 [Ruminococcus sp.]|nr:hypothetical protein [Ruminococcus sp.]
MASRMIHLALGYVLSEQFDVGDRESFLAGSVIPDAFPKEQSHFFRYFGEGSARKTYALRQFRERFGDRLGGGLFLGYYMHLVEDLVFRDHLYHKVGYVPTKEKLPRLHRDYTLLNGIISRSCGIKAVPALPEGFEKEPLVGEHSVEIRAFLEDMKNDLTASPEGETVYYTQAIAEDYITTASEICETELRALRGQGEHIREEDFSWLRHN